MAPKHLEYESLDLSTNTITNDEDALEQLVASTGSNSTTKHLVLVGGGHAHVQVIKALAGRPSHLRVTLIDQQEAASYSGMVPGAIAKLYSPPATLLHLAPLAEWANITFVQAQVVDVDLQNKLIYYTTTTSSTNDDNDESTSTTATTDSISFDALSLDIGSATRDLHVIPGALAYTIPTRPIAALIQRIQQAEQEILLQNTDSKMRIIKVVVVGAGVAGLELALSIRGRWSELVDDLSVTVLDAVSGQSDILPSETPSCRRKLLEILESKDIQLRRYDCGIESIAQHHITLNNNSDSIEFDYCIWATGAEPHTLATTLQTKRGLQLDSHGWIQVNRQLQSVSHPCVFAAGDCASHPAHPPKAGVYAVRSGPILIQNLTHYLLHPNNNKQLVDFVPQPDFLKLMACGDGTALGFRFGIPLHGTWVWNMKDEIDKSFMDLFRVDNLPPASSLQLDISQYDAAYACREHANRVDPKLAAQLLWRDDVDYKVNWKILRDMVCMSTYREQVLRHWHDTEQRLLELITPK
ncbi:Pyridine nucleotide-disulphide oxidoreductase [Seminavis robusta]|uniref:Pyridine nucleotide-disulphide oxidoreductase n=1 Tax=Seminavis robusta TaxID=568900 RepID=A0A9N8DCT4_9STRA|nr:Pyridine nucleotide-disulphide oxidoreductase [Seminavis robusta]|eukprot:Sro32_g020800.1 Pyridine nucleotide-disulphide oxidoreductase (525) ;mRNA; f:79155-80729